MLSALPANTRSGGVVFVGALLVLPGWSQGESARAIFGTFFGLIGLYLVLVGRAKTQRPERRRGLLVIESRGWWGSRRRELPLDAIADIDIEEIRRPGRSPAITFIR